MKSLWNDAEAAKFVGDVRQRVYTARLLGRELALVMHGGGNMSVKSQVMNLAMQATEGLDAEVIDVRSLSPIDWDTIGASVRKTGCAVIVEEGPITGGVGAEIAAGIAERWPKARIARVASPDVPVPFTPVFENAYRPDVPRIVAAAKQLQCDR